MSDNLPGNSLEKAQNKGARVHQVDRVRKQCVNLLPGGNAHLPFSEAFAKFSHALINTRPPCVSYTCWHLLIRLRLT